MVNHVRDHTWRDPFCKPCRTCSAIEHIPPRALALVRVRDHPLASSLCHIHDPSLFLPSAGRRLQSPIGLVAVCHKSLRSLARHTSDHVDRLATIACRHRPRIATAMIRCWSCPTPYAGRRSVPCRPRSAIGQKPTSAGPALAWLTTVASAMSSAMC